MLVGISLKMISVPLFTIFVFVELINSKKKYFFAHVRVHRTWAFLSKFCTVASFIYSLGEIILSRIMNVRWSLAYNLLIRIFICNREHYYAKSSNFILHFWHSHFASKRLNLIMQTCTSQLHILNIQFLLHELQSDRRNGWRCTS